MEAHLFLRPRAAGGGAEGMGRQGRKCRRRPARLRPSRQDEQPRGHRRLEAGTRKGGVKRAFRQPGRRFTKTCLTAARPSRLAVLATWLALPVYAWQGLGVRRRTSRLLPAAGPATGAIDGAEPGVVAAGARQFLGRVGRHRADRERARRAACRTDRRKHKAAVRWRAAGFNSATSGQIRDHVVPNLARRSVDAYRACRRHQRHQELPTLPRFKKEFGGLLYALRAKWPEARIVWQPVIAFTDVPALPSALARSARNPRPRRSTRWATRLCLERGAWPADAARCHRCRRRLFERRFPCLRGRLPRLGRASAAICARRALNLKSG